MSTSNLSKDKKVVAYISPVKSKQYDEEQIVLSGESIFTDCYNELARRLIGGEALGKSSVAALSLAGNTSEYRGFTASRREALMVGIGVNTSDSLNMFQSHSDGIGTNLACKSLPGKSFDYFSVEQVHSNSKSVPVMPHNLETNDSLDKNVKITSVEEILATSDEGILRYFSQLAADFDEEQHCGEEEIRLRSRSRRALIQRCLVDEANNESEDIETALESHGSVSEIPDMNQLTVPSPWFDGSLIEHRSDEAKTQPLLDGHMPAKNGMLRNVNSLVNRNKGGADVNECEDVLSMLNIGSEEMAQQGMDSVTMNVLGVSQSRAQALLNKSTSCLIIIDGTDVALGHGRKKCFSCRGIDICIRYFMMKGYRQVFALVPQWRLCQPTPDTPITDQNLLQALFEQGRLQYIPSKKIGGKRIVHQEDRVILKLAAQSGGIVVSNKHYSHIWEEVEEWRSVIESRVLMYKFVGDILLIPEDPLGRDGPRLDDFLCTQQPAPQVSHAAYNHHTAAPPAGFPFPPPASYSHFALTAPPFTYGHHSIPAGYVHYGLPTAHGWSGPPAGYAHLPSAFAADSYRHNSPMKGARSSMDRSSPARTRHSSSSNPHDFSTSRTRVFSPQMPARPAMSSSRGFGDLSRAMTGSPKGYRESSRTMMGSPRGYGEPSRAVMGSPRGQGEWLSRRQRRMSSPALSSAHDHFGGPNVDAADNHRHLWVNNYSSVNMKQPGLVNWD